jgi:hypothetical protein
MWPKPKPSRLPCLPNVFTRQPAGRGDIGLSGAHIVAAERGLRLEERVARRGCVGARALSEEELDGVQRRIVVGRTSQVRRFL